MTSTDRVLVYGATGHTGRFVVDELLHRGLTPVLGGRSAERLAAGPARHAALDHRVVPVDDVRLLRATVADVAAVINCAGPFLDTALPIARAAVAAGRHYLDVTAEQPAVRALYRELDGPARRTGVAVVPAMALYGGLADLLVSTALGDRREADRVEVAIGLDHWWPTPGTRATGARNRATRLVIRDGALAPLEAGADRSWSYPAPWGEQPVVELPFTEAITLHHHLAVGDLRTYLNAGPLADLRDDRTPGPSPTDEHGRSAQRFVVDVVVHDRGDVRRIVATGRDIYAVTAPVVVEGAVRLLAGRYRGPGALAPGEAFDAADVLAALGQGRFPVEVSPLRCPGTARSGPRAG